MLLLSAFRAQIGNRSPSPDPELETRFITTNPSDFELVFEGTKTRKAASKTSKKREMSTLKFIKNDLCEMLIFAIRPCENLEFGAPSVEIWIQESIKK